MFGCVYNYNNNFSLVTAKKFKSKICKICILAISAMICIRFQNSWFFTFLEGEGCGFTLLDCFS